MTLPRGTVGLVAVRLMTVRDVMNRFACSRATVYRLVARGVLPAVRIGKLTRFRPETVDALIKVAEAGSPRLVQEE